ncbi:MAG: hypothetical protein WCS01_10905, partial [bacterium]
GAGVGAEAPALNLREPWANLFAGKEAVLHATLDGEPFEGRVAWQFSADGRTLARGERAVKTAAGGRETVEIRLAVPEVNPGVIMATKLTVSAFASGTAKEAGSVERTLWVFPPDPFTGRVEWLKKLDIRLFDPVGATAKLFDEFKIPYAAVRNVDALGEPKDGVLVVGEGVSFRDYRGLGDGLMKAAAAGWPILCIAPAGGEITLPVTGSPEMPEPKSVTLRRQDIITQLDKRLDACGWKTDGKSAGSGLKLRGDRGPVAAEVVSQAGAWPWMEMTFDKGRGKLVVCGFGIVGAWAESPTPRFLFVKVLEQVSGSKMRE